MIRIAYLGPQGTFSEAALLQMIGRGLIPEPGQVELVPADETSLLLENVRAGVTDYACIPIENSIDGSISPSMDGLAKGTPVQVFAELTLDVAFSIVVRDGRAAADVRSVAAFPVAAAQVLHWLRDHLPDAELVAVSSNAAAAISVAEGHADAGVTTRLAVQRYGLVELATDVVDESNARTRFLLAGRPAPPPPRTGADRTSVVLEIDNRPGALVAAMTEFGIREIDLTRIESRPTRTELGTYRFFLDCVGHIDDIAVAEALKALHRRCADVRYLGSWPIGSATGAAPPGMDEATRWLERLRNGDTSP